MPKAATYRRLAYAVRLLCVPLYPFVVAYCILAVYAEGLMRKGGSEA